MINFFCDVWFVGFSEDLVIVVWIGNDDNILIDCVMGGSMFVMVFY